MLGDPDPAFAAEALNLPAETFLAEQLEVVDPDALHEARNRLRREIARSLKKELFSAYERLKQTGPYSPDAASAGKRAASSSRVSPSQAPNAISRKAGSTTGSRR